uniref:Zn(2)-C6 fungal-type domain-containing protein n=1 Tax=Spongospora subterranea TaxID=70186 RepID=A0A0H5RUB7_9EUKA|eukprot:CRZ12314.1 hypothetical protein [Spongospora subterranea]
MASLPDIPVVRASFPWQIMSTTPVTIGVKPFMKPSEIYQKVGLKVAPTATICATTTGESAEYKRYSTKKACQQCALAKLRCSERRPCPRCFKHNWDCYDRNQFENYVDPIIRGAAEILIRLQSDCSSSSQSRCFT